MTAPQSYSESFAKQAHVAVLLLFATLEISLFGLQGPLPLIFAGSIYGFLTILLLTRPRLAVEYWIAFSLLSMGSWSHIAVSVPPQSFWGLRIGMASLNVIFTFLLFAVSISRHGINIKAVYRDTTARVLLAFVVYSFAVGTLALALDRVYLDDYLTDLFIFAPLPLYVYLLTLIDKPRLERLIKIGLVLTVYSMALSYATGIFFTYGGDFDFVLMNNMAYVAIFIVPVSWSIFPRWMYIVLTGTLVFLLASGVVFLGGKAIVVPFLVLLWLIVYGTRRQRVVLAGVVAAALVAIGSLQIGLELLDPGALVTYKVSQISTAFLLLEPQKIAVLQNSLGNLVAEGLTLIGYMRSKVIALFFGLGFGGGLPDIFGYLAPMARPGVGYSIDSVPRDLFHRMHLPVYEFILKGGLIGLGCYVTILFRAARIRHVWGLALLIILATVFTNSKDMILLALVFSRAISPSEDDPLTTTE